MNLEAIIGMGIVAFILIFIFFNNKEDSNVYMKILMIAIIVGIILLIGQASSQSTMCEVVVVNSTTVMGTEVFEHEEYCYTMVNSSGVIFYNVTLWIFRITYIYLFFVLLFNIYIYLRDMIRHGRKRGN